MTVQKTPANQASPNYLGNTSVYVHVNDRDNNNFTWRVASPADGSQAVVIELVRGSQQGEVIHRLSQADAVIIGASISAFGSTGTLT